MLSARARTLPVTMIITGRYDDAANPGLIVVMSNSSVCS
jgi:hypothetical protein